ncbi:MAG: hypothetical protein AAF411_24430 [Myxococcota bacterium]
MTLEAIEEDVLRGDFQGLSRAQDMPPEWDFRFRAAVSLVTGEGCAPADAPASLTSPAADGLADAALLGLLQLNPTTARAAHARLAQSALPRATHLAQSWLSFFDENHPDTLRQASLGIDAAKRAKHASGIIECTAVLALAQLQAMDLDSALRLARQASRMARTEGVLQREYLSNWVLARVRRSVGQPAAAIRVLNALLRVVPAPWRALLHWELALCGSLPDGDADSPVVSAFVKALLAPVATQGAFEEAARKLGSTVRGLGGVFADLDDVLAAVYPALDTSKGANASAWIRGLSTTVPPSLRGLVMPELGAQTMQSGALVLAQPGRDPRLLLRHGTKFCASDQRAEELPLSKERTCRALSIVLLSGPKGIDELELFRRVYGFEFVKGRHGGTFRTLVSRMRSELRSFGTLTRNEGRASIDVHAPMLVPDPRWMPEVNEMVLRALAALGAGATARTIAKQVGVSDRTVQRALRHLIDSGVCEAVGSSADTSYRFEDTTFHQPTYARLRAREGL